MTKISKAVAGLCALGFALGAMPAMAEQGGSAAMDELTASIDRESGDPIDARTWQAEYEQRVNSNETRLDTHENRANDHEARIEALEKLINERAAN